MKIFIAIFLCAYICQFTLCAPPANGSDSSIDTSEAPAESSATLTVEVTTTALTYDEETDEADISFIPVDGINASDDDFPIHGIWLPEDFVEPILKLVESIKSIQVRVRSDALTKSTGDFAVAPTV